MAGESVASPEASSVRDKPIDLARMFAGLRGRARWIVLPTFVALIGSLAFVNLATPRYTGVAKVILENQETYFTRPEKAQADPGAPLDEEGVQSQAEALATPDLARRAIDKLGLASNSEFAGGGLFDMLASFLSRSDARDRDGRLIDAFLARLTVFPSPKSRVLQIEFSSRDPQLAARGANTVAALFLESQEAAKKTAARSASVWLAGRIEDLRRKVADAEDKVEAFRAQAGLLETSNGQTVPSQQLADLNAQLATARAQQSASLAKAQTLRVMLREGRLDETQDLAKDESLRRYAEQRVALKAEIAEQSRTLLPEHPHMKELSGQLAQLDTEMRAAASKAARGLENDARLAGAQVDTLTATLARQSKTVEAGNVDDVSLRALQLDASTARDQLQSYMQKYREAKARDSEDSVPPDARVISTAEIPLSPTFPKKTPTVLLVTLAALLVSIGVAASATLMADEATPAAAKIDDFAGARTLEQVGDATRERYSGRFVGGAGAAHEGLEEAPEAEIEPPGLLHVFHAAEDLAAALAEAKPEGGALTTLVTGRGSGRALAIALETARRLCDYGPTVLVDCGEPQTWLGDALVYETNSGGRPAGLADLIAGRADFGSVLGRDLSSRLDVIAAGASLDSVEGIPEIIAALAETYDFVVAAASDWRSPAALAARDASAVAVVVATSPHVAGACDDLAAELDAGGPVIVGYTVPASAEHAAAAA